METRKLHLPKEEIRAAINPKTVDEDKRTVEVTFSKGARVKRNTFYGFGQDYFEELDMKPSSVRLERFKNGAAVLKDHVPSVDSQIGVVTKAEVRNKEGLATVKFSEREDADAIFRDVKAGVIRHVSIGYVRHAVKEMPKQNKDDQDEIPVYRVVDWEPLELSFVAIPADPGAQVRNFEKANIFECKLLEERGEPMAPKNETPKTTEPTTDGGAVVEEKTQTPEVIEVDTEKLQSEARQAEKARQKEIRSAVKSAKLDGSVADEMIERDISADEARKEVLELLAKADAEAATRSTNVEVGQDLTNEGLKRGIENAILHRMNPKNELSDIGAPHRFARMMDLAKSLIEARGDSTRGLSAGEIASRSLHSGSDFPEILANVANKTLRRAYEESPQTFAAFTNRVEEPDFKEIARIQLGDAPQLLPKAENGEYVYGTMSEAAEKYSLEEYGRKIGFSRRMLINDDLNAFSRLPVLFGRAAANLESDIVWAIITANPNMADGNALFSAAHGNLAGSGAAISDTTLGAAREAMRLQTSLDGNKLNLMPRLLAGPVKLETTIDKQLTAITPNAVGDANPFGPNGRTPLSGVVEPRLDDSSQTAWYVFADLMQIDIIELAYLTGERLPFIDSMIDFDTDGMKMKVRHTVAGKAIDWRGMYKNAGA